MILENRKFSSLLSDFRAVTYNCGIAISFVCNGNGISLVSVEECSGLRAQQLSGRKRPHSSSVGKKLAGNVLGESGGSLSGLPTAAQAPVCRPWDRGDLLRRLSTFKSMTWFAKPEVCQVS